MDTNAMRAVGKSRLAVTPLGFGGGTIGSPAIGNEASLATVAAAWETGVRFYDTAPWYGLGRSERRLGLALAALGPRSEFRVNTKIGKTLVPEPARDEGNKTLSPGGEVRTPRDPVSGFRVRFEYSEAAILRQHEDSLQRLGLASVDSLTIHICVDHGVPLAAAALQFPLAHPAVATVIPGAKSPDEPVANRRNLDTEVPGDVWRRFKAEGLLDENAPTP